LLLDQGLLAAAANAGINAFIAWLLFGSQSEVPVSGPVSIRADVEGTCTVLPLLASLIVTLLTRIEILAGRVPAGRDRLAGPELLKTLLRDPFVRAIFFALAGRFLLRPVALSSLQASGLQDLSFSMFLAFKIIFSGVLGAVVCPLAAWLALHDGGARLPTTAASPDRE
jgi:hypothetical protein